MNLRRELRSNFEGVLLSQNGKSNEELAELLADAALKVAAIAKAEIPAQNEMDFGYFKRNNGEYNAIVWDVFTRNRVTAKSKVVWEIVDKILSNVEETMRSMFDAAMAHDISPKIFEISERLAKGLGFSQLSLTPQAVKIYEFVQEQESKGQKIETFCKWAKQAERVMYIKMYKNDPENIMTNWPQAFSDTAYRVSADDIS